MTELAFRTGSSVVVKVCQVCGSGDLKSLLFLGFLPPVNAMRPIGEKPHEQPSYPAQLLKCGQCELVQLGLIVDPVILFPSTYPYTSSTTKILRENFAELYKEVASMVTLGPDDLIVDIGSNDGNLLSNFTKHKVLGVTPEDIGKHAVERGIPTLFEYFSSTVAKKIVSDRGRATIVTATNVFAHIENVNEIVTAILEMLSEKGLFITESHYLGSLVETLQYDTIYHEHLRYYSLKSLKYLLERHGLEIIHAKKIPSHGGSIRVYAARKGTWPVRDTIASLLREEEQLLGEEQLKTFKEQVTVSKLELHSLLAALKKQGKRIYGIGAPSRASTLINYVGLDDGIIDAVMEIPGSYKIGNYIPGTLIPVKDESSLYRDQPDFALLFSWHIADELIPKIRENGFKGGFIVPLPHPRIVE